MTTKEIKDHIHTAIKTNFDGFTTQSDEMQTSEGGDGRFHGTVFATRYSGLAQNPYIFLAIGETEKKVQIVKLGNLECLIPGPADLDVLLEKELGIKTNKA